MILLVIPIIIFFSLEEEFPQGSSYDEVIDETQNQNSDPSIPEKKSWTDSLMEKSGVIAEKIINSPQASKVLGSLSNKFSSFSKNFSTTSKPLTKKA